MIDEGVGRGRKGDVGVKGRGGEWEKLGVLIKGRVEKGGKGIDVRVEYGEYGFGYRVRGEGGEGGL